MEDGERQRQIAREVRVAVDSWREAYWRSGPRGAQLSEQSSVLGAILRDEAARLQREAEEFHQKIRDAAAQG